MRKIISGLITCSLGCELEDVTVVVVTVLVEAGHPGQVDGPGHQVGDGVAAHVVLTALLQGLGRELGLGPVTSILGTVLNLEKNQGKTY